MHALSRTISSSGPTPGPTPAASIPSTVSQTYRLEVARRIIQICSQDTYDNITDFEWYLSVLVDLAYVARVDVGEQIKEQLLEVAGRVKGIRRMAVGLMARVLSDEGFVEGDESCKEVLGAAAWICGEYCKCETALHLGCDNRRSQRGLLQRAIRSTANNRISASTSNIESPSGGYSRLPAECCQGLGPLSRSDRRRVG